MLVLVANLGSTSFKYRLFEMTDDGAIDDIQNARCLAKGAVERIGDAQSRCTVQIGDWSNELTMSVPDHGVAVQACLDQLTDPENGAIENASQVAAIGFKAVHGGRLSGVFVVDDHVLDAMAEMNAAAPAHNPPYIATMKTLQARFPDLPLVAAFETDFHQTIPAARKEYAIPRQWADEFHIRKWGFHGASHRYIAFRSAEILGRQDARVISCHLGGSSSITAIENRQSVQTTMGMTPQTGLPQNNRVGDFDPFALPLILQRTGLSLDEALQELASKGGLLGLSNRSGDIRDVEQAASEGDSQAQLALDVFIEEIRRHLGGMLVALGGADAIVFTGGIGENDTLVRSRVCAGLEQLGIVVDPATNESLRDRTNDLGEASFHAGDSKTQLWVIPTNEEVIVARQTLHALKHS
ncbi:acetate/propionate family kinase [Stieleria sp. ICT_E10.1]|uniref:acetate/propionate family kinase n=1 Tax=Stieleria sedimenti TaxID=2976331 RepID=UPI002180099F|nr:acetate/propionate family kinase [Stieleria sedimenti]MCS7467924.1 acetate/propionate family kinase [Stieleria sedimenti]